MSSQKGSSDALGDKRPNIIIDGVNQSNLLFGKSKEGARDTFFYQGNDLRKGK